MKLNQTLKYVPMKDNVFISLAVSMFLIFLYNMLYTVSIVHTANIKRDTGFG